MGTSGTLRKLLRLILVDGDWVASFYKGQQEHLENRYRSHEGGLLFTIMAILKILKANKFLCPAKKSLKPKNSAEALKSSNTNIRV